MSLLDINMSTDIRAGQYAAKSILPSNTMNMVASTAVIAKHYGLQTSKVTLNTSILWLHSIYRG
jgi:hypothetical protein